MDAARYQYPQLQQESQSWLIKSGFFLSPMTANEPSMVTWTSDQDSTESRLDTKSIELGMSGMSLVSENGSTRKATGSTISTTPPDDEINMSSRIGSSASNPPSPVYFVDKHTNSSNSRSYVSRPPGLGGPTPMKNPGHAKTTSNVTAVTAPLLTLTPNSSVDGNSEWTIRQPSPPEDGPAMPFLTSVHRRLSLEGGGDSGSMDSYDQDQDDDGLLGLGALRDNRSQGAYFSSNSPPVARSYMPSYETERRRDRPPLSQTYIDTGATHSGDRGLAEKTNNSSAIHFQQTFGAFESGDTRGFGAIARPELRQYGMDFDSSVRSAGSGDNYSHHSSPAVFIEQQGHGHVVQKFGSLPSLGSHIQNQRAYMAQDIPKPRHVRAVSQPVHNPPQTVQVDSRIYEQQQQQQRYLLQQRSAAHPPLSSSYDPARYASQKRNSLPNFSSSPSSFAQMRPTLERRDALDFHGPVQSSISDDVRLLGNPSLISPAQSPHQVHYVGHSRQPSDPPSFLSTSPGAMGSTTSRSHGVPMSLARQGSYTDDDLQYPLIGENIDVSGDQFADTRFLISNRSGVPLLRATSHGHSVSMGEISSHYVEHVDVGSHHLLAARAALPQPNVVYSVKFKRTQRNFVLGPRIARDLKIGTYVKVEADRGEDLGIVVGKVPADKFNFASRTQYTAGMGPPGGLGGSSAADLKRIIRLATHDEVSLLGNKREEEEELLKICRGKVRQRGLPMNVVDAEYQFDRHKITFFFEAEGRVDFRELVRDLFSMYKTRIWMQQLDKNTSASAQAIIAPQANFQIDSGTPIIAPTSEFADLLPLNGMGS